LRQFGLSAICKVEGPPSQRRFYSEVRILAEQLQKLAGRANRAATQLAALPMERRDEASRA
jgi:hypothetical protein